MESNKDDLLESDPYDCPVLNVTFLLEVNPSDSRSISARLYLLSSKLNKHWPCFIYSLKNGYNIVNLTMH